MTDTDPDPAAGQRDGTEPLTAKLLFVGTVAAVALRGLIWVFSSLTIGPLIGMLDLILGGLMATNAVKAIQAVLTVAAVGVAMVCAAGLRADPARFRRPVRLLSRVFVADVVVYLASIIMIVAIYPRMNASLWTLLVVATAGNLALAWLALVIGRRTRTLPESATA